jgi:hypothetical protein
MSVQVRDIDAIRRFRLQLMRFAEELEGALQSMQQEVQKSFEWIDHEAPHYWTSQIRRAYDLVASTRMNYESCRMRTVAGHRAACIEEKQAYERAKRRLQHCQEQKERVRQWGQKIHHSADEFRGRLSAIRRLLDVDIPEGLAYLANTVSILEKYAEMERPAPSSDEGKSGG